MKKDIDFPKVEGVHVAIVEKLDGWFAYIINRNPFGIENVMVTSRGYGIIDEERRETSVLRHVLGNIESECALLIEPIDPQIFVLNNEYWVSYFLEGKMYDKKFIFIQGSIINENFTLIPELNLSGVLHN